MRLAFSFNPLNTTCMEIDQHRAAILIHILQIVGDISLYLLAIFKFCFCANAPMSLCFKLHFQLNHLQIAFYLFLDFFPDRRIYMLGLITKIIYLHPFI